MWVYESFVIICMKEIQVKFAYSYPSSEKEELGGSVVECLTEIKGMRVRAGGTVFCP